MSVFMPNTVIKAPIPIRASTPTMASIPVRVPNSFPNRVPQPYGYNPSPLQPPADYYVTRKEVKELLESVNLPNPGDPSQTDKFATREWVKDTTGLQGTDDGKTVREVAAEETAKIVDGAPAAFDTLKEVANWIQDDTTGAAAMAAAIAKNTAAVDELKERPVVEVVEPTPDGAGKAADAKAVYEELEGKLDKSDVVNPAGEARKGQAADAKDVSEHFSYLYSELYSIQEDVKRKQDALNDAQTAVVNSGVTKEWKEGKDEEISALQQDSTYQAGMIDRKMPLYTNLSLVEGDGSIPIYPFVRNEVSATLEEITVAGVIRRTSDGSFSFGSDIMLDCSLVIDCRGRETAPTITWPANFHPRADAETDFKCEAGKRNVYWISEYAEGEFVVAGWQETEGGNAQ